MTIHLPDGPRTTPKQWEDVWRYQVSVEYALDGNWDLRLGFAYDESPIPDGRADFIVPANDRKIYSIGFGYSRGPWQFDVAYAYLDIKNRDVTARPDEGILGDVGFRSGDSDLVAFTLSYRF